MGNIEKIIMKKDELSFEDIEYLMYKTSNRTDFLTLNHIESRITNSYQNNFIEKSMDKIEFITSLLLADKKEALYEYYKGTFNQYMKATNNSFEGITSFNFIFITLVHLSLKIIRSSASKKK